MTKVLGIYSNPDAADDGGGQHSPRGVPLAGIHSQRQTVSHGATHEQKATLAAQPTRTIDGIGRAAGPPAAGSIHSTVKELAGWKSIAVFLDDTPKGEKIGECAVELAHRCGAHLIGLHGMSCNPAEHPSDSFACGKAAIHSVMARLQAAERQKALAVGRLFTALSLKQGVSAEFRMIRIDRADDDTVLNSLHCDLVLIGHPDPPGLPKGWSPERLLMASGVPVLIIPDRWKSETIGNNILVGWNASREARRAMADAMPFLSTAQSVTVLVVDPAERADRHGEEPGADIALCLARHGVHVDVEQATSNGSPIGEIIRSRAVDRGMDLIVVGAYSHARWAEIIFGGVTRTLLTQMPVPVLASR
jgi:nucleotide-binding universal stress UspA family protein